MAVPVAALAKLAAAALSDEDTRRKLGWIVAAICSPLILTLALICSLLSGSAEHNNSAVLLCFNGGTIPDKTPAEYVAYIEDMRRSFTLLEDAIAAKEKELAKIMRYKQALYQDWKDGEITRNDYRHMSEDYERQAEALNNVLRTLTDEQEQLENGVDAENPFLAAFLKYQNIDKLTREILAELIDYIKVYEGGNISVKFKYADEFRRMAEYIELNAPMVQEAAG